MPRTIWVSSLSLGFVQCPHNEHGLEHLSANDFGRLMGISKFTFREFEKLIYDLNKALSYRRWIQWIPRVVSFMIVLYLLLVVLVYTTFGRSIRRTSQGLSVMDIGIIIGLAAVFLSSMVSISLYREMKGTRRSSIKQNIDEIISAFNSKSKLTKLTQFVMNSPKLLTIFRQWKPIVECDMVWGVSSEGMEPLELAQSTRWAPGKGSWNFHCRLKGSNRLILGIID